jgi:hypothetical protein
MYLSVFFVCSVSSGGFIFEESTICLFPRLVGGSFSSNNPSADTSSIESEVIIARYNEFNRIVKSRILYCLVIGNEIIMLCF